MNWSLIGWCFGALLTLYVIKFMFMFIRRVFSKNNVIRIINSAEEKASSTSERLCENLSDKWQEHRERKRKMKGEENQPVVVIR